MSLKKLKKENPELNFNIIDELSKYDKTETKKLTGFIVKMFKKSLENTYDWEKRKTDDYFKIFSEIILEYIGYDNLLLLDEFSEHLSNNRIENNDISKYNSWCDVINELNKAELKVRDKELCNEVELVYEDDTWLSLKPLSFKASLKYGSNTKWCVSMKNEPSYFYRYSKEGVLIFILNKKTGEKFAFYNKVGEFSVWDQLDKRIDSIETGIPYDILVLLKNKTNIGTYGVNFILFSENEVTNFLDTIKHHKHTDYVVDEISTPIIRDGDEYLDEEFHI